MNQNSLNTINSFWTPGLIEKKNNPNFPPNKYKIFMENISKMNPLDPTSCSIIYSTDQAAMLAAIEEGDIEKVKYFLQNGIDLNSFQEIGVQTFLGKAAFRGDRNIVELLVQWRADIHSSLIKNQEFRNFCSRYFFNNQIGIITKDVKENFFKKTDVRIETYLNKYSESIQILLEYAAGINFDTKNGGLEFLNDIDISGFNFVGMSLDGEPINEKILKGKGFKWTHPPIITWDDLQKLKDENRKAILLNRLEKKIKSRGRLISKKGIVNLVPLAAAAENNQLKVLKKCLGTKIRQDAEYDLAIQIAAKKGFYEIVELLTMRHCFKNETLLLSASEAKESTPNHQKIYSCVMQIVEANKINPSGKAPIHIAVEKKDINEIKKLLDKRADINCKDAKGQTPLFIAVKNAGDKKWGVKASENDIELIKFLLSKGARSHILDVIEAAHIGSSDVIKILLPNTEKQEVIDSKGKAMPWFIPIMRESYGSDEWISILNLLKDEGADLNALVFNNNNYFIPTLHKIISDFPDNGSAENFMTGVKKEQKKVKKLKEELLYLLKQGADPEVRYGPSSKTALHYLVGKNLEFIKEGITKEILQIFLDRVKNSNTPDLYGNTPLHEAVKAKNLPAALYLIERGANLESKNASAQMPLDLAEKDFQASVISAMSKKKEKK